MTLILTAFLDGYAVLVSDRRISIRANGEIRPLPDPANKLIMLQCVDAHAAIAYTGSYKIGHENPLRASTDAWLVEESVDMRAGHLPIQVVVSQLAAAATRVFAKARSEDRRNGLTIICQVVGFSGWAAVAEISPGLNPAAGREVFGVKILAPKPGRVAKRPALGWAGAVTAVSRASKRDLARRRRRLNRLPPPLAVQDLVDWFRVVNSQGGSAQGLIGRECMAAVFSSVNWYCSYHPDGAVSEAFDPHIVTPHGSTRDGRTWFGEGPPPWAPPEILRFIESLNDQEQMRRSIRPHLYPLLGIPRAKGQQETPRGRDPGAESLCIRRVTRW